MILNICKENVGQKITQPDGQYKIDLAKGQFMVLIRPSIQFVHLFLGSNLTGAEVGVQYGLHAMQMVQFLKPASLYLVDSWDYFSVEDNITTGAKDLESTKQLLAGMNQVKFIVKKSVEASNDFLDGMLDFVYIDADHSYEAVKQDILAWTPKVRDWGVVAGHDWHVPSVKKAVVELRGEKFYHMGDDWWFINNDSFMYIVMG